MEEGRQFARLMFDFSQNSLAMSLVLGDCVGRGIRVYTDVCWKDLGEWKCLFVDGDRSLAQ
jgi:hypothetical protein